VVFDTEIVDLTSECQDPVDTLMKVQLGGGTDIGKALRYAESLIENPRRTIVLLITDFYEGGPINELFAVTRHICEAGSKLLGLAALDGTANPSYDQNTAQKMVNLGAEVGAMTPGELAAWVAEKVR
jgi:Mg-chelatase subunit ChlD